MPVTTQHPEYANALADWEIMAEALEGERAVKANRERLPKPEGMVEAEKIALDNSYIYKSYVERAEYPHWVKDGLRSMMGLVSRIQPEFKLPVPLAHVEHEATSDGFGVVQLFQRVVAAALAFGRLVLVVDVDEEQRPFIAVYSALEAINWKEKGVDGRKDLALVVLREPRLKESEDEFGHDTEIVYRVLDLLDGNYRVRLMKGDGSRVAEDQFPGVYGADGEIVKAMSYIPVVFAGSVDNAPDIDEIPLQTMAKAALKFYQLSADYYQSLHRTAHPQPWVAGLDDGRDLRVTGPSAAWALPEGAQCGYLEITGGGIDALRQAMTEQRNTALEAGARVIDIGGVESGDARRARQDDQHATLHSVVVTAAEAVEQALRFAADWVGVSNPNESVTFTVKPDFSGANVDPVMAGQLLQAAMAGRVSNEAYWMYVSTGKLPERPYDEEALHIENPGGVGGNGDEE
ncbi:MAG: hypothetical protein KER_03077 [Kerstersia gyiorum]|uniref:DUF4055 domain-containing protein n=1 Tax=Kerstersia gyiorum TaxID=206506 RepID=UPI0030CE99E7